MFDMPEPQTDELDPSHPFRDGDEPAYVVEEEQDPLKTDLGGGFADATRSVRVWGDEFGRLKRVRLSLRWKERLPHAEDLSTAFSQCLRQLQYRFGGQFLPEPVRQDIGEVPPYSAAAHRRLLGDLLELRERAQKMAPVRIVGGGSVGVSRNGKVKVRLGQLGDTDAVEFDESWLGQARSSEISAEVLSAHDDAYDKFEAPVIDAGEYLEIQSEILRITDEITAMAVRD